MRALPKGSCHNSVIYMTLLCFGHDLNVFKALCVEINAYCTRLKRIGA